MQQHRTVSNTGGHDGASAEAIFALIDRALHDARFRARLCHDPTRAAAELGLELSATDWAGVRILMSA
jgi:hypothetical protein